MRSFAVHPSYRPPTIWPSAEYMAFAVPAGFDEMEWRVPLAGEWFISQLDGSAQMAEPYAFKYSQRILRKRETWPTTEYAALPVPEGMIKTGELLDPLSYTGSGTHYLGYSGKVLAMDSQSSLHCLSGDPRRYILRRPLKWELVETGEEKTATGGFYIGEQDGQPHESFFGFGHVSNLRCTEIK